MSDRESWRAGILRSQIETRDLTFESDNAPGELVHTFLANLFMKDRTTLSDHIAA